MKRRDKLRIVIGPLIMLVFLSVMILLAYVLTNILFRRAGVILPGWIVQVLNSLLGMFFAVIVLSIVGFWFRSKRNEVELGILGPIVDALERIARGDFNVRLEESPQTAGVTGALAGTLAKSVNKMALELNQMEAMRQEFISNVSHEIQSPLTSIRGFARALQNDGLSPQERAHYLQIVESESIRLSKLSDNLLELTSLESEHRTLVAKPYRLDRQIRDLILACEPQWSDKRIDVDVALEEVTINADEDMLCQLWTNLLHNSIKFTPDDGSIRVELSRRDDGARCRIVDSGIGIAEDDLPHIFERFYKADASRRRTREGNGLGLAIVKKIVDMHGGTIGVQSTPGSGTTFTVMLPLT